jgi:tetratricopeptide (TPR) repeat protein
VRVKDKWESEAPAEWELKGEVEKLDVPDTIFSVITSRIDRLDEDTKHALRCASVIGDVFHKRLLREVFNNVKEENIQRLKELDFLVEDEQKSEYTFKHVLIKDSIYSSLLPEKRRELHERIAEAIEELYEDRLDEFYEALAHHWQHTDNMEKRVEYLLKAGKKAESLYLNQQAIHYYNRAKETLETSLNNPEALSKVCESLGDVHRLTGALNEAIQSYEVALGLSATREKQAELYRKIGFVYENRHEVKRSLEFLEVALQQLGEESNSRTKAMTYTDIARTLATQGSARKAVELCRKSLQLLGEDEISAECARAMTYLGVAHARQGQSQQGVEFARKGYDISQKIGDPNLIAWAQRMYANVLLIHGDLDQATANFQKSFQRFEQTGDNYGMVLHYWVLGGICRIKGALNDAVENYLQSIRQDKEQRFAHTAMNFLNLSGLYALSGDFSQVEESIKKAIDIGLYKTTLPLEFLSNWLTSALCDIEKAYVQRGEEAQFVSLCKRLEEAKQEELQRIGLKHLCSPPQRLSSPFTQLSFVDDFEQQVLHPEWIWNNPRGDSSYDLSMEQGWIAIKAAPGCNLTGYGNMDAPRLLRHLKSPLPPLFQSGEHAPVRKGERAPVPLYERGEPLKSPYPPLAKGGKGGFEREEPLRGDFAMETKAKPLSFDVPFVGGLLVWELEERCLRLERDEAGRLSLCCKDQERWKYVGSRFLPSYPIYMRLERLENRFLGYGSADGENWTLCGEVEFSMSEPVHVGLYAIGAVVKTGIGIVDATTGGMYDYFKISVPASL